MLKLSNNPHCSQFVSLAGVALPLIVLHEQRRHLFPSVWVMLLAWGILCIHMPTRQRLPTSSCRYTWLSPSAASMSSPDAASVTTLSALFLASRQVSTRAMRSDTAHWNSPKPSVWTCSCTICTTSASRQLQRTFVSTRHNSFPAVCVLLGAPANDT